MLNTSDGGRTVITSFRHAAYFLFQGAAGGLSITRLYSGDCQTHTAYAIRSAVYSAVVVLERTAMNLLPLISDRRSILIISSRLTTQPSGLI